MHAQTFLAYTDKELLNIAQENQPEVVAIDAPLSLPLGRKTLDDRTGAHFRESDRALMRRGIKFFPMTLGPMRKLSMRGIALRKSLEAMGLKAIEAYPGGAQDVLGIP
jgi:predicted nuclease with RNAse H fold